MIVIDSKEANAPQGVGAKILAAFKKLKVPYRIMNLQVGDYANIENTFIAERKSLTDLWNSLIDGRLDRQTKKMYELYKKNRYFFIEVGAFRHTGLIRRNPAWIYSKYGQMENIGINVREYIDYEDLVYKLHSLDRYIGSEINIREKPKKIKGIPNNVKLLMGIDGVGEKKAVSMLEECGTPINVFNDIIDNDGARCAMAYGIKQGGAILTKVKEVLTQKWNS